MPLWPRRTSREFQCRWLSVFCVLRASGLNKSVADIRNFNDNNSNLCINNTNCLLLNETKGEYENIVMCVCVCVVCVCCVCVCGVCVWCGVCVLCVFLCVSGVYVCLVCLWCVFDVCVVCV